MKGESLMVKPGVHRHLPDARIVWHPKDSSGKKRTSGMTRSSIAGPLPTDDASQHLEKSFSRSTNVVARIAAILLLWQTVVSWPTMHIQIAAFVGGAPAKVLGSYLSGCHVTEVLAEKVTTMDHAEGLAAILTTSSDRVYVRHTRPSRSTMYVSNSTTPRPFVLAAACSIRII
jgi:hypothetical protein